MSDTNKKKCWACQADLDAKQVFCLKCEKWQDFRRHFSFSTTVLSLIVAIIAVSAPILDHTFRFYDPLKVQASFSSIGSINEPEAILKVVNQGKTTVVFTGTVHCDYRVRAFASVDSDSYSDAELRLVMEFEVPDRSDRAIEYFQVYRLPQKQTVFQKDRPALSDMDALHKAEYEPVVVTSMYHPSEFRFAWIDDLGCTLQIAHLGEIKAVDFKQTDVRLLWKVHIRSLVEANMAGPDALATSPLVNRPFVGLADP